MALPRAMRAAAAAASATRAAGLSHLQDLVMPVAAATASTGATAATEATGGGTSMLGETGAMNLPVARHSTAATAASWPHPSPPFHAQHNLLGRLAAAAAAPTTGRPPASCTHSRGFAAAAAAPQPQPQPYPRGFIEIREYTLTPVGSADWIRVTEEYAEVRQRSLPLLGMFSTDVGSCLHKVTHYYHYKDFDERDAVRAAAARAPEWAVYLKRSRPYVQHQESKIMLEAGPVYDALRLPATRDYQSPEAHSGAGPAVYEQRTYQLHPGYGSVPKLVEAFAKGLPDKVASDPEGQLVFLGYTDVGMLNNVVELWRYPSAQACIRARQAARQVTSWRETIAAVTPGVQHFTSTFLKPLTLSPWK